MGNCRLWKDNFRDSDFPIRTEIERKEKMNRNDEEVEIDLMQLFRALMQKAWAIILAAVIFGGCAMVYTLAFVTPLYKARTLMYVNNSAVSVGDAKLSVSTADLSAAQGLVDTNTIILGTRSTLDDVIEEAGLPYSYEYVKSMISAAPVNGTQIFYVDVTSPYPKEAELIANTIGRVLPGKIAAIVEGTSARIVDYAVVPAHRSSPSLAKNTILGMLVGIVLSCGWIVVKELMDDEIRNPDYLTETFELPVLAVVPELTAKTSSGYYKYGYSYGYGRPSRSAGSQKAKKSPETKGGKQDV